MIAGMASTTPSQKRPLLDGRRAGGSPGGRPYGGGGGCCDTSVPSRSGQGQVDADAGRDGQQDEVERGPAGCRAACTSTGAARRAGPGRSRRRPAREAEQRPGARAASPAARRWRRRTAAAGRTAPRRRPAAPARGGATWRGSLMSARAPASGSPTAVEMRLRESGAQACTAQNGAHWWPPSRRPPSRRARSTG